MTGTTKTKAQVEKENAQLTDLVAKQQEALERMDARIEALAGEIEGRHKKVVLKDDPDSMIVRDDKPEPGGGWMVKSPRPDFDGMTCGVRFDKGVAIVDVELKGAEKKVHQLEKEYGYEVTSMTASQLNDYGKFRRTGVMPGEEGKKVTVAEALIR